MIKIVMRNCCSSSLLLGILLRQTCYELEDLHVGTYKIPPPPPLLLYNNNNNNNNKIIKNKKKNYLLLIKIKKNNKK